MSPKGAIPFGKLDDKPLCGRKETAGFVDWLVAIQKGRYPLNPFWVYAFHAVLSLARSFPSHPLYDAQAGLKVAVPHYNDFDSCLGEYFECGAV